MYYLFSCDFCFEIEADGYDKALKKAWAFIHANLPKDFVYHFEKSSQGSFSL